MRTCLPNFSISGLMHLHKAKEDINERADANLGDLPQKTIAKEEKLIEGTLNRDLAKGSVASSEDLLVRMKRQMSNLIHPHVECSKESDDSFAAANFNSRKSVTRPNIATIESHKDKVFAVAVCGDLLYTATESKDIRVFRAPMFEELDCFGSGSGTVQSLMAFEQHLYSAHQDNKIRVWKRVLKSTAGDYRRCKHKLVAVLPRLEHCVKSMLLKKNYVQIRPHKRKLWIQHIDTISALALGGSRSTSTEGGGSGNWCPPPSVLYSASWDKTVKVWSLNNFKCLDSFYAHQDAINAIMVIEGSILVTASADGTIKLWRKLRYGPRRTKKHGLINTLEGHQAAVNALAISGDNKVLYSGGSDGTLMAWKKVYSCKGQLGRSTSMKGAKSGEFLKLQSRGRSLAKQRSQQLINSGMISGEVSIGSTSGSEEIITSRENSITLNHGLSSIKKVINSHNRLHALNSVNFIMKKALIGHTRAVLSVSTVGDNIVCSSSADTTIRVWLRRGREKGARWEYACMAVLGGHGGPVKAIASVSPTAPIIILNAQQHQYPAAAGPQLIVEEEEEAGVVVYSGGLDSKVNVWALSIPR